MAMVNLGCSLVVRLETAIHFILDISIRMLREVILVVMSMRLLANVLVCYVEIIGCSRMSGIAAASESLIVTSYMLLLLLLGHAL